MAWSWFRRERRPDVRTGPESTADPRLSPADAHMERVVRETGQILAGVPVAEQGRFMVVVASATDDPGGPVVLAEQHEGTVASGATVSVMALPAGAPDMEHHDALLGTRALAARVVAYDAATGRLQLSGPTAADLTPGSMITR